MSAAGERGWLAELGAACFVTLAVFGSLVSTSGLVESIRRDLGLTFAQGGFLLSVPFPLIAFFAVTGGVLVDRLGVGRMVGLGAALVLFGGGGRAWGEGFWVLAAGTALVGAGTGMIFPALPKIVSATVPAEKKGLGAGLYTASVITGAGLGVAASQLMAPLAAWLPGAPGAGGWRGGYLGWALILGAALLFWRALGPGPSESGIRWVPGAGPSESGIRWVPGAGRAAGDQEEAAVPAGAAGAVLRNPAVWAVAFSLFINNVIFYTAIGWLPSILIGKGWAAAQAAGIVSLVPWLGVVAVLAAHPAAALVGGERAMVLACALATAGALAPLPAGGAWTAAAGAAVLGFSTNFWFLFCMSYPARHVEGAHAGRAGGLIIGLGYLGGFVGPWAAGAVRDAAGGFGPALYALAGLALTGILTVPFFGGREAAPPGTPAHL